jgi:hypothetical protein
MSDEAMPYRNLYVLTVNPTNKTYAIPYFDGHREKVVTVKNTTGHIVWDTIHHVAVAVTAAEARALVRVIGELGAQYHKRLKRERAANDVTRRPRPR